MQSSTRSHSSRTIHNHSKPTQNKSPNPNTYTSTMYPITVLSLLTLPFLALCAPQGLEVQLIGAYYCTGTHWTGGCAWTAALAGNCVNIDSPSETSFSFGPDQGLVCKLFEIANCQTGGTVIGGIRYPGWADVSAMTQNRGLSVVRSWRCEGDY